MDRVGYQVFVIPKTGIYKFSVYGAGHGGSYRSESFHLFEIIFD